MLTWTGETHSEQKPYLVHGAHEYHSIVFFFICRCEKRHFWPFTQSCASLYPERMALICRGFFALRKEQLMFKSCCQIQEPLCCSIVFVRYLLPEWFSHFLVLQRIPLRMSSSSAQCCRHPRRRIHSFDAFWLGMLRPLSLASPPKPPRFAVRELQLHFYGKCKKV